jgi:hypothetical protein
LDLKNICCYRCANGVLLFFQLNFAFEKSISEREKKRKEKKKKSISYKETTSKMKLRFMRSFDLDVLP